MAAPLASRAQVFAEIETEEPHRSEAPELLDVDELVRQQRGPPARLTNQDAPRPARQEDVVAEGAGFGPEQRGDERREKSEVHARPRAARRRFQGSPQSDWRSEEIFWISTE